MTSALNAPPPFPIARFSVEQYHRLIASGVLTEDDRLELIEGWVVAKLAKGPAHEYTTGQLEEILRERVAPGWHVRNQAPITLARSEPEPDLAVVRGQRDRYRTSHPSAGDVALVVEVSETTLTTDRLKGKTYGASGIPEYWIVNLVDRFLELYTQPSAGDERGYAACRVFRVDESVDLAAGGAAHGAFVLRDALP